MRNTFSVPGSITVAAGKVGALQITTPASGLGIILSPPRIGTSTGPASASLLEDYSFTDAAETALTPLNSRRALPSPVSATVVKAYADITAVAGAGATTLETIAVVGASNPINMSSVWSLKKNKKHLLAFSNPTAGPITFNFLLKWEE